jgi:pyruvate dehydrogenase E2 component (dihydrolipoamide acetyltransferase)
VSLIEVRVPDLGDAKGVNVVDVLVKKGSEIRVDDPLITLETDKASMDVPSPVKGIVNAVELKKGDEVSAGALIATVQVTDAVVTPDASPVSAAAPAPASAVAAAPAVAVAVAVAAAAPPAA